MVVYLMEDHELVGGTALHARQSLRTGRACGASWLSRDGDADRWHSAALG